MGCGDAVHDMNLVPPVLSNDVDGQRHYHARHSDEDNGAARINHFYCSTHGASAWARGQRGYSVRGNEANARAVKHTPE